MVAFLGRRLVAELAKSDCVSALAIEGIAIELIAEVFRTKVIESSRADRAACVLREHFREAISLSTIAKQMNVHPAQLAREFRHRTGISVGECIRRLRVEYAIERLTSTSIPIAEIAHAAGFADQSHFCRVFRNCTGATPAQFRAAVRERNAA